MSRFGLAQQRARPKLIDYMAEYYIREADVEEARGPFDKDRLSDLIEAGRANENTLYYDDDREDWFPLAECEEMSHVLHPEKRHIQLRAKSASAGESNEEDNRPPILVDDMLAAAEGESAETRHLKVRDKRRQQAAAISLPALGAIMLLSAFLLLYPFEGLIREAIATEQWQQLYTEPMIILGLIDVFLMICCFLSVTDIFPILRVRAMLGLGYFTYIYWSWQEFPMAIAAALSSLAIYICTATLNLYAMILFSVLGILGMGFLAVSVLL